MRKRLDLKQLRTLDDDAARDELTQVKGVGRFTTDGVLALRRSDLASRRPGTAPRPQEDRCGARWEYGLASERRVSAQFVAVKKPGHVHADPGVTMRVYADDFRQASERNAAVLAPDRRAGLRDLTNLTWPEVASCRGNAAPCESQCPCGIRASGRCRARTAASCV